MKKSECPESFLLIKSSLLENFDDQGESIDLSELISEIKNQKVWFIPVNVPLVHWQFLFIVNALEDSKPTATRFWTL